MLRAFESLAIRLKAVAQLTRRTFQDLGRAVSDHATVEMHQHYSTVGCDEVREGLSRVISLGGFRAAHQSGGDAGGDVKVGASVPKKGESGIAT